MAVTINPPPKADAERVSRLVERTNAGEIKIPKFQRGFVWKPADVLDLLESILQGYPIGSLLFWRTDQKLKSERDIQGFLLPPTPDKYPTNYVLDGQQRLTTIYAVLSYKGPAEAPQLFNVIYDLRKREFRPRQPKDGRWCLPLNAMLDFPQFNAFQQQIASLDDGDTLNREAERVNETFREYQIPVVTLTDRSLDEVCPIFERINSTGTKLTVYDLMVAATFSEDFDLNEEVQALAVGFEPSGFTIDGDSILRTLSAVRGKSVKKRAILALRDVPRSELRDNLGATRKAMEKAVDFLRTEVGVVSSEFLPYEANLTVLSKVFSLRRDPLSPEQRGLLRSWFWMSSFGERYRGASDSILDTDIESCQGMCDQSSALLPAKPIDSGDLRGRDFRKGTAVTHAFVALLATCNPRNIVDGAPIDVAGSLSWENQKEFHHIFPKAYLATGPKEGRERQSDIANIMFLPSAPNKLVGAEKPSVYMTRLAAQHGSKEFDRILASNLVPPLDDSGLLLDDFEYFLEARLEMIVTRINDLAVTAGPGSHAR